MSSSNGTNNTPAAPSWLDAGAAWAAPATGHDGAQVPATKPPATQASASTTSATTAPSSPPSRPAPAPERFRDEPPTAGPAAEPVRPAPPSAAAPSPSPAVPPSLSLHQGPGPSEDPQAFRAAWDEETGVLSGVVRERRARPQQGWRHFAYQLTGGRWNPGLSEAEARLRDQLQKIRTPLPGPHSVVVGSIKGGIGKTTVSALLGLALAEYRGDRVIAMDANPDAGTLGDRLVGETLAAKTTVRDLLYALDEIRSATDLAGYTHLAGRLQVLTSDLEPEAAEMFSADDYEAALRVLYRFYNAIITDSGTGIVHSAMQGSLRHADSLVIVGAPTEDGSSRAARTFKWLAANGYRHLTEDAVVVLSYDRHSPDINDQRIRDFFAERCRAVIVLPPDPHLQAGGIIDFDALTPAARDAALELAATVAEGFQGRRTHGLASHGFRTPPTDPGGPR
ncbi:MinD/ParA family protein [Pseudonocardia alni]|uniref:MinD/ParA family ATP-binding protein n=1 Tax=Pseudonocardia alni TaxID=33907 RepID=UPI0033D5223A